MCTCHRRLRSSQRSNAPSSSPRLASNKFLLLDHILRSLLERSGPDGADKRQKLYLISLRLSAPGAVRLTSLGLTSRTSSGTRKISAPSFLAMEIASLAALVSWLSNSQHRTELTILPLGLKVGTILDKRVVDDTRFDGVEEIEEEDGVAESGVFEAAHGTRLAALFHRLVRPFDHILIGNAFTVLADLGEGLVDAQAHELPYQTEHESSGPVDNV